MLTKDLMTAVRSDARKRYQMLPEPSFKYGLNIFFAQSSIALPVATAIEQSPANVSAVDGVITLPFSQAAKDPRFAEILMQYFSSRGQAADRIFAFHESSAPDGLFIYVEQGAMPSKPVRIDVCLRESARADQVLVYADRGSKVTVVEHLFSDADGGHETVAPVRTSSTDIIAKEGSEVTHIAVQNFADDVTDFTRKRAWAGTGASVRWIECHFGGSYVRSSTMTRLQAPGATVKSRTIFFGDNVRRFDLYNEAVHEGPRTTSDLLVRGALKDKAKTIYRGLIRMEKGAGGSTGRQDERTLLLSEDVEIDAVPNLEIEVDDVRCSHAAAAGRIDAEQLFYLMSRGLDEKTAMKALVDGFFAPTVRDMTASGLEEVASCIIDERLERT